MAEAKQASRTSDEAVRAKTGKVWEEWFRELDAAGAAKMSHKEIVAHLDAHYEIGSWWQQSVTVAYEKERGLREKHQRPDGYEISVSRTLAVPLAVLYRAWENAEERARWLPDAALTIRRATPEKSLRTSWGDGGERVDVNFYPKGDSKSQVTVTQGKLADAEQAARSKAYWAERLDTLKAHLGG
ncbi:MAG: DUF4287 domain-containing protein [Gemmatimonadota bacterium]|nr:DUF4287 domain-containing protein [Gemmatimonadota bacterium]MDQ3604942.1 DUF4287 domain-containing protein [Gemmatimonadota bacterium]